MPAVRLRRRSSRTSFPLVGSPVKRVGEALCASRSAERNAALPLVCEVAAICANPLNDIPMPQNSDPTLIIKFCYDFKSPFTFLAFDPALDLERTHRVKLRFVPHVFDFEAYGGSLEKRDESSRGEKPHLYSGPPPLPGRTRLGV